MTWIGTFIITISNFGLENKRSDLVSISILSFLATATWIKFQDPSFSTFVSKSSDNS